MAVPAVFYARNLPRSLVVETPEGLWLVPMVPGQGWGQRYPYLGHRAALQAVPAREGEIQLRSTGWTESPGGQSLASSSGEEPIRYNAAEWRGHDGHRPTCECATGDSSECR